MLARPFFSVIIPTYNRAELLRRALESVEVQTFKNYEVIVCDDGSSDHTAEVVDSFRERIPVTYLWEVNWGGAARPRNNGLKVARGEWVCFLDADDWWYSLKLERIRELSNDADVIYHDCRAITGCGSGKKVIRGRRLNTPVFEDLMVGWNPQVTSSTCVRKSVLDLAGGFDEDSQFVAVEDFDLWLRIARVTERFVYVPEVLGVYVLGNGNISHFSETSLARERAVYQRHAPFLNKDRQRLARRMIQYREGLIYWSLGQGKKSREKFLKAIFPARWRHRLLVVPWIIATFFCRKK